MHIHVKHSQNESEVWQSIFYILNDSSKFFQEQPFVEFVKLVKIVCSIYARTHIYSKHSKNKLEICKLIFPKF